MARGLGPDELGDHTGELIKTLDSRIAATVATTTASVIGLVQLLGERDGNGEDPWIADSVVSTLVVSFSAGIERLYHDVG
jgi:hypothetical protein